MIQPPRWAVLMARTAQERLEIEETVLTVNEIADLLHTKRGNVYNWAERGRRGTPMPHRRYRGKTVKENYRGSPRFRLSDVERWMLQMDPDFEFDYGTLPARARREWNIHLRIQAQRDRLGHTQTERG